MYQYFLLLLWLFMLQLFAHAESAKVDSLEKVLGGCQLNRHQCDLIKLYKQLGGAYAQANNYEKALTYYLLEHNLAQKSSNDFLIAVSSYRVGLACAKLSRFAQAIEYHFRAIDYAKDVMSKSNQAKIIRSLASIYTELGLYQNAYQSHRDAIMLSEAANDTIGQTASLYSLGSIFYYQDNYEQALTHYKKSLAVWEQLGKNYWIYSCLDAIGSVYWNINDYEKAIEYNLRSLALAKKINYKAGMANAARNAATAFDKCGEPEKALEYLTTALGLYKTVSDRVGEANVLEYRGRIYYFLDQPYKALKYLLKAQKIAQEVGSRPVEKDVSENLYKTYSKLGNYAKAYETQKTYVKLTDQLLSEITVTKMAELKEQQRLKEHEGAIDLLEKEKEIQNLYQYVTAGGSVLVVILLFFTFNNYQFQSSTNERLKLKNQQIQLKHAQLARFNADLDQFAHVAANDLKQPLTQINTYLTHISKDYENVWDKDAQEFIDFITDAIQRMNRLLTDLLLYARVDNQDNNYEIVPSREVLNEALSNLQYKIENQNANIKITGEMPKVCVKRTQIVQLFQNLIGNALKFKEAGIPEITIHSEKNGSKYIFSVNDNGIGIPHEYQDRIFKMFQRLHTNQEYEGTGIGLAICQKIVLQHQGRIWLESEVGKGSTFYFSLPFV